MIKGENNSANGMEYFNSTPEASSDSLFIGLSLKNRKLFQNMGEIHLALARGTQQESYTLN